GVFVDADGDTTFADNVWMSERLFRRPGQRSPVGRANVTERGQHSDDARVRIECHVELATLSGGENVLLAGNEAGAQGLLLLVIQSEEVRARELAVVA